VSTNLEKAIADATHYLESLHREQDLHARTLADPETTEIQRGFCTARLDVLDELIAAAKVDLEDARKLQFSAAFSFGRRDVKRMLKLPLRRRDLERQRKRA